MTTDRTVALLERENPVHENDLPEPDAALRDRIALRAPERRRPRRHFAVRLALVGAVAAAAAFGALSLLPGDQPSAVERAAAALNPPGEAIIHTVVVSESVAPDGSTDTGTTESWQRDQAPFDERSVTSSGDGRHHREVGSFGGEPLVYDEATDTIFTLEPGSPNPPRKGLDNGEGRLVQKIRSLLESGKAYEDGHVTIAGRDGIRIVAPGVNATLVVDAGTFAPLEWTTVADDGTTVTSRVQTYEMLPATEANIGLLDVRAQHPGADEKPGISFSGF